MEKKCFKCGIIKPLSEFYAHSQMADGHLGKCKTCTQIDTRKRDERRKKTEPNYLDEERKRGRQKYHRLYRGTGKADVKSNMRYFSKYPEKRTAHSRSQHLKKPFDGAETHHWSYNEPHYRDVVWLSKKDHMKGHRFIMYDQERMMYRRFDTMELLDTKEKHEEFIRLMIETQED